MYSEFAADPKVQLLSFDDQRHFVVLLCLKCNGTLDSSSPSPELRDRMMAKAMGLELSVAKEVNRRLCEVGVITPDWQPVKWDARQYESDTSTERTRAWRNRQKQNETSQERHGDVTVTDEIQNRTEQSKRERKRSRRAPEDFSPDLAFAESVIPDIDASAEAAKFRDWEFKTPRSDWSAVWRNWVATCKETGRYAKRGGGIKWM